MLYQNLTWFFHTFLPPGFVNSSSTTLSNRDCTINMEPECQTSGQTILAHQSITTSEETTVYESSLEVITSFERKSTSFEEWKGKPLSEMNSLFNPVCQEAGKVEPGRVHTVLFKVR